MQANDRDSPLRPRMGDCRMISTESLDPRGDKVERNPKLSEEIEIEEVKLFGEGDDQSVRIKKKNVLEEFKQKLIALLKKLP